MTTREEADRKLLRYLGLDQSSSLGTIQGSSLGQIKSKDQKTHPLLNLDYICNFFRDKVLPNQFKELLEDFTFQFSYQDSTPDSFVAPSSVAAFPESAAYSLANINTYSSAPSSNQAQEAAPFNSTSYILESPASNQHLISEDFIPDSALSQHQNTFHSGFSAFSGPACSFVSPITADQLSPAPPLSETTAAPRSCYTTCAPFNCVCNCPQAFTSEQVVPLAPTAPAEIIPISYFSGASGDPYTPTGTHPQPAASNDISYEASADTVNLTQHNLLASKPVFLFPQALPNTEQSQNQAPIPVFVVSRPLENFGSLVAGGTHFFPINSSYPTPQSALEGGLYIIPDSQNYQYTSINQQESGYSYSNPTQPSSVQST